MLRNEKTTLNIHTIHDRIKDEEDDLMWLKVLMMGIGSEK